MPINTNPFNIEAILHNDMITQHYQPIIELSTCRLFSYESLMRCKLGVNPEVIFRDAILQKTLYQLDTYCISKGVEAYFSQKMRLPDAAAALFVNIFPSTLLHPFFMPFVEQLMSRIDVSPSSIVFEINECKEEEGVWEVAALKGAIAFLRSNGFRIAMDDVGEGAAGMRKLIEFEPDFIKMSRYFAHNLAKCARKQKMLKLIVEYGEQESQMILEGLEYVEDLKCAIDLGVAYGQGYILGRPREVVYGG